ncbi:GDA1/CD39 family protein [Dictyocaulus viviparus]|uniref:GDA1/CD39 family protein n=1 Tax=Dictyocaulus viviparus TaxID=29172 RepID=A0A0D8XP48_DICVI|nr:GDA1/CD39 family protein [Dictyocaulus viviparus]
MSGAADVTYVEERHNEGHLRKKLIEDLFLICLAVSCRFFAIVFDGGSTGTRLHLYKYVFNTDQHGIPFKVEEEIFREMKPGLSSYGHNPPGAAASIRSLIQIAQRTIPVFMWNKTPIAFKATAGLRLLPGDMAEDIMIAVEREILESGFFVVPDSVGIMSGSDEGIYGDFKHPNSMKDLHSVAAFDLGGGSTQVTFWPTDQRIFNVYEDYERDLQFFDFLGNGLVAARLNALLPTTYNEEELEHQLTTPCMPADFRLDDWEYALKKWNISGMEAYSFQACYDNARQFVANSEVMELRSGFSALRGQVIYLFSYFYDRGLNAELVKENSGGVVKLLDFKKAAEKACSRTSEQLEGLHWLPWQCQDLSYIYSLLHDGYGFEDTQPLFLAKKIKGMVVAWAQGLSYTLVHEFHKTQMSRVTRQMNITVVEQIISYIYSSTNNLLSYFNLIS